jgi:hypothetical protein
VGLLYDLHTKKKKYCHICGCILDYNEEANICECCLDDIDSSNPGEEILDE